jgi:hypothetical protein
MRGGWGWLYWKLWAKLIQSEWRQVMLCLGTILNVREPFNLFYGYLIVLDMWD